MYYLSLYGPRDTSLQVLLNPVVCRSLWSNGVSYRNFIPKEEVWTHTTTTWTSMLQILHYRHPSTLEHVLHCSMWWRNCFIGDALQQHATYFDNLPMQGLSLVHMHRTTWDKISRSGMWLIGCSNFWERLMQCISPYEYISYMAFKSIPSIGENICNQQWVGVLWNSIYTMPI